MNNLKLKAFLDAYYAPYSEKHRYWTGLLLVIRLVLLFLIAENVLDNSQNLLAVSTASFGLLVWPWMIGSAIYRNWYLNALNSSYIVNLGILSVITLYCMQAGENHAVITCISTSIALATFVMTVLGHIYVQSKDNRFWKVLCCKTNRQQSNNETPVAAVEDRPLIGACTTYLSYGANKFREPLLEHNNNFLH